MLSLVIETSTERGAAALIKEGDEMARIDLPLGTQNSQHLLPEIQTLLHQAKVSLKELNFMVVGIGPGSYTGMRVGAMMGKTLSYSLKIPLIGISSLEAFLPEEGAAIIDAKIGGAYVLLRGGKPTLLELPETVKALEKVSILATPVIEPLRSKLELCTTKKWDWRVQNPNLLQLYRSALVKYAAGDYSQDGQLALLYLRKTQAEIERDKNCCG